MRGASNLFPGHIMAAFYEVVVVTINYRLGALGKFECHSYKPKFHVLRSSVVTPCSQVGGYHCCEVSFFGVGTQLLDYMMS
jgi:Carboxylesterase type B